MPDPVLVPPTPVINQTDSPEEIKRVGENVQEIFDRVVPERGAKKATQATQATPEAPKAPKAPERPVVSREPAKTPAEPPPPESKPPEAPVKEPKIPSFIEKALSGEAVKPEDTSHPSPTLPPAPPEVIEEWPEELPVEEKKSRIKGLRDAYKSLKEKVKTLEERPAGIGGMDPATRERLDFLENRNKEMETVLSRTNIEHHTEFQNRIVRPMNAAWNEAARIVHETGGNPDDLSKALALSGKAHFEALDEIFAGMPESAKIEANNAVSAYRRSDAARRQWLADPKNTAEALRKQDLQRHYQMISKQQEEMKGMFDSAIAELREKGNVEVLKKSSDPDAGWWNEQADQIVDTARNIFLENTDMKRVAFACALAPMVDVYRRLWMTERAARAKSDGILKEKFGSEPSMSESGGNVRSSVPSQEEDLKKPFTEVFLREFHRARNSGVR